MQKPYYEQPQGYPGYFQHNNGYGGYESQVPGYGPAGDPYTPSSRSSCLMQTPPPGLQHPGVGTCPPAVDYPHQFANSCMQNVDIGRNTGPAVVPGGMHPNPPSLKHHPQHTGEIYPWMRESRHNSKQRQQQQQHPQQPQQLGHITGKSYLCLSASLIWLITRWNADQWPQESHVKFTATWITLKWTDRITKVWVDHSDYQLMLR